MDRLAVASGALGLVVVLAAAAEGAVRFTAGGAPAPPRYVPAPLRRGDPPPRLPLPPPPPQQPLEWPGVVLVVLLVLAAAAVLWWWARRLRWRRAPRATRSEVGALGGAAGEAVAQGSREQPDAPVVRRGIARALDALGEDRTPGDAVVAAWLGLQQAAEDSGVVRAAAETPTEFTSRLLERVGADRAAARELLGLYLRARFADRPTGPAQVARARAALEALQRSWQEDPQRTREAATDVAAPT